jgi:hypothetical protein
MESTEFSDSRGRGVPLRYEIELFLIVSWQDEVSLELSILSAAVSQHNISDHI